MVRLESVSVYLSDLMGGTSRTVLHNVTMAVRPGQGVALLGPNGAGKSTLLLAIAGAMPPSRGKIYVNGLDILPKGKNDRRLRELMGVSLQLPERGFYARNVREEVGFTCQRLGWPSHERDKAVVHALERVGLSRDFWDRSLYELSGGEKRLVALASAIAHRPRLLLLDEPEAGLDRRASERITTFLQRFTLEGGTALVVTHDLEGAFSWANRFLLLDNGRLARDVELRDAAEAEWRYMAPWLWDRAALGRVHSRLWRQGLNVPSPYAAPDAFIQDMMTRITNRMGRRLQ